MDNMSNWSLISQLTIELILNTMVLRQEDPITFGNCIHILYLLSSIEEIGGKIRGLGGAEKNIKLLPRQFSEKRGEDTTQSTCNVNNNNLCFTRSTLRHLTEPDINDPYYPRIGTGANRRKVLETLQAWEGDETSKGLTLQVLYNLMGEVDKTHDTSLQNHSSHPDIDKVMDPQPNSVGEDSEGHRIITRAQGLVYRLEIETHTIERVIRNLQNQPHITTSHSVWE